MSHKYLIVLVCLFLLAACRKASPDAATPTTAGQALVTPGAAATSSLPAYDPAKLITTPSGLQYVILSEGQGDAPQAGDTVSVHYTGWLPDGTQFDSSREREPFTFQLGAGQVIAGWDEGIALLKPGAKALLIVPPDLGYGNVARGPLPANSTLYFEVELVTVAGAPEGLAADDPVSIPLTFDAADLTTTDSGLQYLILKPGDGPAPQPGDTVEVDYTGWLKNGTPFDSSIERGQPIRFILGTGRVIAGWDEGMALLKQGAKALLVIPSDLGYGPVGQGSIPGNATLYFQVELLKVDAAPAPAVVAAEAYTTSESGLRYADLKVGDGDGTDGATAVEIHYTAWVEGGYKFDSSRDRDLPFRFVLDQNAIFPGLEEGVKGMRVGGVRQLVIPPALAFGEQGRPPAIPPNATLIFEIELMTVDKGTQ